VAVDTSCELQGRFHRRDEGITAARVSLRRVARHASHSSARRLRIRGVHAAVAVAATLAGLQSPEVAASSASTRASITGTILPAVPTVGPRPRSVRLSLLASFQATAPDLRPATVKRSVIFFPHGATVNSRLFPSCSPKRLHAGGPAACPPHSQIGLGSATGSAAGISEQLKVTLFNGPGGRSELFYLAGSSPAVINGLIDAPLVVVRSLFYGYQLTLPVPASLQVIAGIPISVTQFQTTVGATIAQRAHGKRVDRGYLEVPLCPPGALLPLRGVFSFVGAPTETVNSSIACGQPPPA
jgi:hypothetical protein